MIYSNLNKFMDKLIIILMIQKILILVYNKIFILK